MNNSQLAEQQRWRRLSTMRENYNRWLELPYPRRFWATVVYFAPFFIIGIIYYLWADTWLSSNVRDFLSKHHRLTVLFGLLSMYLLGLMWRDLWRYDFRIFAAPIICNAILLFALLLVLISPVSARWVEVAMSIFKESPWLIVLILVLYRWGPHITRLIPRVQKAELPGGTKFEIDKLDELQRTINPWKKTVTRFAELMQLVSELIEETSDDQYVRFLAYTPALGYLTRTDKEWRRLYKLLVERDNIQIICLEPDDLHRWHRKFEGKQTVRLGGVIDKKMIERANSVSSSILEEKQRHRNPRVKPVMMKWEDMPGYYMFANHDRAVIVAPLFLPGDPNKEMPEGNTNNNSIGDTPVKMLGFESTDNWTVWLVNQVCDQYVREFGTKSRSLQPVEAAALGPVRPANSVKPV